MGLGKARQAVNAADKASVESVCIVCPAFLKENWRREIALWAERVWQATILSYDIASRDGLPPADAYVFDEGHYLKNPTAKRTKRLLGLDGAKLAADHPARTAAHLWPLSGTPAPNNAGELWPWLRVFGATSLTHLAFLKRYCRTRDTAYGLQVLGNREETLAELRELIRPYFLRRTLATAGLELPASRWGGISLASTVGNAADFMAADLLIDGDDLPPADDELARVVRLVGEAKAKPLAELLADELTGNREKLVVFAWHHTVLDTLFGVFARAGFCPVKADGRVSPTERQRAVDRFQADPDCRVFVGQIQAAGTGLTLTASHNLVFAELSWVPGDNAQAAKRVDRIGQTEPVLIRTATLSGTIDEAFTRVLERKTRAILELWEEEN